MYRYSVIGFILFFAVQLQAQYSLEQKENSVPRNIGNGFIISNHHQPAILKIHTSDSSCTASLIGPKTLITAAHCKSDKSNGGYFYIKDKKHTFKFYAYEGYILDDEMDIALGVIDEPVLGIVPLNISLDKNNETVVTAFGFGCSNEGLSQYFLEIEKTYLYTKSYHGNWERMKVCLGDSGGPVMTYVNDKLHLIGIITKRNSALPISKAAVLAMDYVYEFVMGVQKEFDLEVCGFNREC